MSSKIVETTFTLPEVKDEYKQKNNDEPNYVNAREQQAAFEEECRERVKQMMKEAHEKADKYPEDFWNDDLDMEDWFSIGNTK